MSKERELLKRVWASERWDMPEDLQIEIKELLAQPEQEPVDWEKEKKSYLDEIDRLGVESNRDEEEIDRLTQLLVQPNPEPVELEDVIKQIHDKCYQTSFDTAPVIAVRDALTIFRNYLKSKRDITAK